MANQVSGAPPSNEGKVDSNRGTSINFPYNKAARKTGKVGSASSVPNSNQVDANVRKVSDPRLV